MSSATPAVADRDGIDRSGCPAPRHGSAHDYTGKAGCRCPDARDAARVYRKRLREGRLPAALIDPTGSRRRIQALQAIGWPMSELVRLLGRPGSNALSHLNANPQCRRSHAIRITVLYERLRRTPGPSYSAALRAQKQGFAPPSAWDGRHINDPNVVPDTVDAVAAITVDPTGSRRRIQALQAIGWPKRELGIRLGWQTDRRLDDVITASRIFYRHAEAIAELYRQLCTEPGPSSKVRAMARAAGYPQPLDWDAIDDPAAQPVDDTETDVATLTSTDDIDFAIKVELACAGELPAKRLSEAELKAVVERLAGFRLSATAIALRLHTHNRTVNRFLPQPKPATPAEDTEPDSALDSDPLAA
jgi:hypothetical protein